MSARNTVRSKLLGALISPLGQSLRRNAAEWRRKMTGRKHIVSVFLQIDDPYSYLLACYLPALEECYDVQIQLHLSEALGDAFQPAPDMLAEYAVDDCRRLARELGVPFLDKGTSPPTEHRVGLTDAVAAGEEDLLAVLEMYWRGDSEVTARHAATEKNRGRGDAAIEASRQQLKKLGHYNSAMLHYGGEWYWGVDRLHYLLTRLDDLDLRQSDAAHPRLASIEQVMQIALPVRPPDAAKQLPPLKLYLSLRSPYAIIALPRVAELANAFSLRLDIRLVMPMVMRGMQVPKPKLRYIAIDAAREAARHDVPFGRFADPVGAGIERLYGVAHYARAERKETDFLLQAAIAIWSEAIDVSTDTGMRKITGRTGLFWPEAQAAMQEQDWREEVERNRTEMMDLGSWGVPTVSLGDYVIWGQDRLWLLARHIEDLCDTGDGILV